MKLAAPILPVLMALALPAPVRGAATFTDIGAGLTGLTYGSTAWGDYDNDGDLDIAIVGTTIAGPIGRIYRNDGGAFANANALPAGAAVSYGSLAWGDYDRDGDLDLAIAGYTGSSNVTRIYRNSAGAFTDIGAGLEGLQSCAVSWADFDNDGDLDLGVIGYNGSASVAHVYRNTAGTFADADAGITGLRWACMAWSDFDLDRDLDLIVGGSDPGFNGVTTLYRNTAGAFSPVAASFPGVSEGSMDWGDYDQDGDPDVLITGYNVAQVWRNTAGTFAQATFIQYISDGMAVWGDYDNDGRIDIASMGATGTLGYGAIFHNDGGSFSDIGATVPDMLDASVAWGNYDNDGDLDLMIAGVEDTGSEVEIHRIYRCDGVSANSPPAAPTSLSVTADATTVMFHWSASTDAQGALGLSYNLWAGTAPATPNVMPPMANLSNGFRRVAQVGNVGQNLQWTLPRSVFAGNPVHWGVQAIDHAFAGSAFATGPSGTLGVGDSPLGARPALRVVGANPSATDSRLAYSLPSASAVDLAILDVTGRRVRTLVHDERSAGEHEARWSGEDDHGSRVAPGVYFARLDAGGEAVSIRILRIE